MFFSNGQKKWEFFHILATNKMKWEFFLENSLCLKKNANFFETLFFSS